MSATIVLALRGAGDEPIDFRRTITSHGLAALAPARILDSAYERDVRIGTRVRTLRFEARGDELHVSASGPRLRTAEATHVRAIARRIFRLDDDLQPFYAAIANDARLGWAAHGAGRLLASPSIFEDVVKTICTTNCAWSATIRMNDALVELGGGAFPDAALLARTPERWFAERARMGYRGPYIRALAREVDAGRLDLDALVPSRGFDDDEVEARLLALAGVGPYAAAHIMQLLGRHHRLILDSWTRPNYLRIAGKKRASDATMRRAFARYGRYAGLAFWLYLTQEWT
ncbi:MAG: Fe-S cluster assembly protein HesB [bacterium]|nr:Fe-S cluster assembly protein HesB [bacterium]